MAIVLASLALMSAVAIAAGVTGEGGTETAGPPPSPTDRLVQRPNTAPEQPKVFVPREEISADKPVSFPSDI